MKNDNLKSYLHSSKKQPF